MLKRIQLRIDSPCHENWENMRPEEKGRFCAACQKSVVDFSNMSDGEILARLRKAKGEVCGRLYVYFVRLSHAAMNKEYTTSIVVR